MNRNSGGVGVNRPTTPRNPSPVRGAAAQRGPAPVSSRSPAPRTLSAIRNATPPRGDANHDPDAHSARRSNGIVTTPRLGNNGSGAGGSGRTTPVRSRPVEMTAAQKAAVKRDHTAMVNRVGAIMAGKKPEFMSANGFRIDARSDEDMRLVHKERMQRDPLAVGLGIRCEKVVNVCADNMGGILRSPRTTDVDSDPAVRGRRGFTPIKSQVLPDHFNPSPMRSPSVGRKHNPTAHATEARSTLPPWDKGTKPPSRPPTPNRAPSPISFNPHEPITPWRSAATASHRHHDVFGDQPLASDAKGMTVTANEPDRPATGVKRKELIDKDLASQPPPQLPARKPPAKKQLSGPTGNDLFNQQPVTASAARGGVRCVAGGVGKRLQAALNEPFGGDDEEPPRRAGKRTAVAADPAVFSPHIRKVNPNRGSSSLEFGPDGLTSSREGLLVSPCRRASPMRPACAAIAVRPHATAAPFASAAEFAAAERGTPERHHSATRRSASAQRFQASPQMRGVLQWES